MATYNADFASEWGALARDSALDLGMELRHDRKSALHWGLTSGGFMRCTGIGGSFTGYGFNLLIIDDPVKDRAEAESEVIRNNTWNWYTAVARTRLEPNASIIVLMTRWHEDDLVGRLLAGIGEKYDYIRIPALADSEDDPLGRDMGQAIWPSRYNEEYFELAKETFGPYDWAGLFQQLPAPLEGGMFQREWWQTVDEIPYSKGGKCVRGWDLAGSTKKTSPWTVGVKMWKIGKSYYIEDVIRFRGQPLEVEQALENVAQDDGRRVTQDIPQDPGQSGKGQARYMARNLAGYDVKYSPESGDKAVRAVGLSAQTHAQNVFLKRAEWNHAFKEELALFPNSTYTDQTDAASRAFHRLTPLRRRRSIPGAPQVVELENMRDERVHMLRRRP